MKAYLIDSESRTVTEIEYKRGELQKLVGGWIETACVWDSGDVLYVDEEGLLKDPRFFFRIPERPDQPLAGNGVLVGREVNNTSRTAPPTMTIEELIRKVTFYRS